MTAIYKQHKQSLHRLFYATACLETLIGRTTIMTATLTHTLVMFCLCRKEARTDARPMEAEFCCQFCSGHRTMVPRPLLSSTGPSLPLSQHKQILEEGKVLISLLAIITTTMSSINNAKHIP